MRGIIQSALSESARLKAEAYNLADVLIEAAKIVADAFTGGGRLFLFGNGGSAADAQHLAAEFVNRFRIERPPLPALALTTDTSILTSIANDYSFNEVFAKQLKALARTGDVAWGISTSGNSPNVVSALTAAKALGLKTIALTGAGGGDLKQWADVLLEVNSTVTPRIQEVHLTLGHVVCELVDYLLFQRPGEMAVP